jgi:hypothetical protein
MENIKHPNIAKSFASEELETLIKNAFQTSIENEENVTKSQFRKSFDSYVSSLISNPKGSSAISTEIKEYFGRGRKWITIPSDHELYNKVIEISQEKGFEELIKLFESQNKAWVRYNSNKNELVYFTIHPDSSTSSNTGKFTMTKEVSYSFDVLSGTPKSNGFEGKVKKTVIKKKAVNNNSNKIEEVKTEASEEFFEKDLSNTVIPETSHDWDAFLSEEGLDWQEDQEVDIEEDDLFSEV